MEKINSVLDNSLPKQQILHSSKEFEQLLKGGKRVNLKEFDIIYSTNNFGYPRMGYIVSKKISTKAVIRNRIKRLFREYFRHNKSYIGSRDIIFICKQDISSWNPKMIGEYIRGSVEFN
ncbi:MAG: ribonuclease P protein component [Thermodesulfobacteriota bacterium]